MRRIPRRMLAFAAVVALLGVACQPRDRRPGLWLSGEVAAQPVADWAFTEAATEIFVETRTWYGIPHSVTTACAADGDTLYVPSVYFDEGRFPDAKFWNRNVVRDPRVRLGIDGRLYERRAVLVTDPEEIARALAAFTRKYPFWKDLTTKPESQRPAFVFLRMDPPAPGGARAKGGRAASSARLRLAIPLKEASEGTSAQVAPAMS